MFVRRALVLAGLVVASASIASAQGAVTSWAGPPAPVAPEVFAKDAEGRITLRATRLSAPLSLDGNLDEAVYTSVQPIDEFIQQEPHEGSPAQNRTDAWVFYDDKNIYVAARCWTIRRPSRIIANEMRRDSFAIFQNDNFGVMFDTFHDRRNGFFFYTNPLGAVSDQPITDERDTNRDWNTVWDVKAGRFDGGGRWR